MLFQFVISVLCCILFLINKLVPAPCWFQFAKIQFYFQLSTKKMVSRSFDSFDCSTDGDIVLIVSSREPVEQLSIPFRFFRLQSPKTASDTSKLGANGLKARSTPYLSVHEIESNEVIRFILLLYYVLSAYEMAGDLSRMSRTRSFDSFYCSIMFSLLMEWRGTSV